MGDPTVTAESGAYVWFSEDLDAEQRERVTISVDALVARSRARYAEMSTDNDDRRAFAAAHLRLVEQDAAAVEAITELEERRKARFGARRAAEEWSFSQDVMPVFRAADSPSLQIFPLPYHFAWEWHNGNAPAVSMADRVEGTIRVGTGAAFDAERSDAHAGFGVFVTTDVPRAVIGRSFRRSDHEYMVSAGGFGGDATAEGGLEMTALEDGRLLDAVADKRFRRRVSDGESESVSFQGGLTTGNPLELTWTMQPNKGYTFNVGGWVFCEQHFGGGLGGHSFASGELRAQVSALTITE